MESHKKLSAREKKAESERIMRGELSETSTKQLGELQARHESLLSGTTSLASALGEKMPELQDEDDDEMDDLSGGVKLLNLRGGTDSAGLGVWEDEAERAMYESIPDLRERLPGACLTDAIPLEKGEIEDEDENKGETEGDKEEPEKIVPVFT